MSAAKTAEDFKKAAAERNITRFLIHDCSICGFPVGFIIYGDTVVYDNSCDCAHSYPRESSWQEIADPYNLNANAPDAVERMEKYPQFKQYVDDMNKVWGFDGTQ